MRVFLIGVAVIVGVAHLAQRPQPALSQAQWAAMDSVARHICTSPHQPPVVKVVMCGQTAIDSTGGAHGSP